jgi:outer membrane protein TolC
MAQIDEYGPKQTLAYRVREFFRDLFGSKLVSRLEVDLLMARSDLQQMRQDKDQVIAELRAEKAQLSATVFAYQLNINRRVGIDPTAKKPEKPNFASFQTPPVKTSWQVEVEAHNAQIEKELAEEAEAAAKK